MLMSAIEEYASLKEVPNRNAAIQMASLFKIGVSLDNFTRELIKNAVIKEFGNMNTVVINFINNSIRKMYNVFNEIAEVLQPFKKVTCFEAFYVYHSY